MKPVTQSTTYDADLLWLQRAAKLNGKTPLTTALMVLAVSRRLERRLHILLTPKTLNAYGINRTTAYRSLRSLEEAGLVTVRRHGGCPPLVSIVDASCDDEPQHHVANDKE